MIETDAINIVSLLLAAYPSTNATDGTVELWVNAMSTVPEDDGKTAAMEWIRTSKFFPTIADVNEILTGYRRKREREATNYPSLRGPLPTAEEGMQIAKIGYLAECRARGREPNPKTLAMFDAGVIGGIRIGAQP